MKTIYRKQQKAGYTHISNDLLQHPELSLRAIGLASKLLSNKDGWQPKIGYLCHICKEGEAAIREAFRELATYGFMMRERVQDETGKQATVTYIADYPAFANVGTLRNRLDGYGYPDGAVQVADLPETDLVETDLVETDRSVKGGVIITNNKTTTNKKRSTSHGASAPSPDPIPQPVPAKKKGKQPAADKGKGEHQAIIDAYYQALSNWEISPNVNGGEMGKAAKDILKRGFTPEQVAYAVNTLKADPFWDGKHLRLTSVGEQLGAIVAKRNGVRGSGNNQQSVSHRVQDL